MTDKEFGLQMERVEKAYHRWADPTGMYGWIVSHLWYRDGSAGEDYPDATARAQVSWEYLHVTFHWNLTKIATNTDSELERIVLHEICHALINEMRMWGPPTFRDEQARDEAGKHEERVVSELTSVLLWTREAGYLDKKAPRKR